ARGGPSDAPERAGRPQEPAGNEHYALAVACGDATGGRREGRNDERSGDDGETGAQHRITPHAGEELDVGEERGREPDRVREHRQIRPAEVVGAKEVELDERRGDRCAS